MRKIQLKWLAVAAALTLIPIFIILVIWVTQLNSTIKQRLSGRRFAPPTEFFSAPERFFKSQHLLPEQISGTLKRLGYRERANNLNPAAGQYSIWLRDYCLPLVPPEVGDILDKCLAFKKRNATGARSPENSPAAPPPAESDLELFALTKDNVLIDIFKGSPLVSQGQTELQPELFAQFYGVDPILRSPVELGEAPPLCLNALLAIEDAEFLEHRGVSVFGIGRAVLKNLFRGRLAQGGSTITQQLIKNYFLSPERTFKRKINEIFMAVLLELNTSKDDILETYINEIYMGQNGPFQVRGFGAASEHYFNKPLSELDLPQCALLAAIVNNPGRFNPFHHPDDALKRRNKVLDRMVELKILGDADAKGAKVAPAPSKPKPILSEPAPYFVESVRLEIKKLGLDKEEGLKIFTTMDLRAQESAQRALRDGIDNLEKNNKTVKGLKAKNKLLEGAFISSDPLTGHIEALVGGRAFKVSQFNRALQSRRQIGSIVKPFVYLAALETLDETGKPFTPVSLINDQRMHIKYDKQDWSPDNYEGEFYGEVPLYFALKSSLNAATASLGLKIGLESIVDICRRLGVESPLKALPALTLGVYELTTLEVLQAYTALARLGDFTPLTLIDRIEDLGGKTLYKFESTHKIVTAPENAAVLIGMMKQTNITGTAKFIAKSGFNYPSAGKTGTTSDTKDAWYGGFTPYHVAVVWLGYDDNTPHNLTGASGAVPIWLEYMKKVATQFPPVDFQWPPSTEIVSVRKELLESLGVPRDSKDVLEDVELVFRKGTAPLTEVPQ